MTGYKIKSDAERESNNPESYAPYSSGGRNKVGADFDAKILQKIETANDYTKVLENGEPMVVYHGVRTTDSFSQFNDGTAYFIQHPTKKQQMRLMRKVNIN